MAELQIEGDEVLLHLSRSEKLEAIHADLRAPLTAIRSIEVLNDAHEPADHGFKVGERLPGISEVATVRTGGERIFAVVHHDRPRGVRVVFEGTDHDAWIVGAANPEKVAAEHESKAGGEWMIAAVNPELVLLPLVIAAVCFDVFCLVDLARAKQVKYLPKWLWAVLICFVGSPISGAVYLAVGKDQ